MDSSRDENTLFRISQESSVGKSSRIYNYRKIEGVPFEWERQPGTPKINPSKEDVNIDAPLTLSPPPNSFQSLGHPKPCLDDHESKCLKVWLSKKIKKLHSLKKFGKSHQPFSNYSTSSLFSTDSFASNTKKREKYASDLMEVPYFCNLTSMDKEEAYRKMHKKGLSEEYGETLFLNRILSRMSSVDQYYYLRTEGIPFKWEMQPGTPIYTPQNEVIPPPSPPPMLQSLALPKPCISRDQKNTSTWERIKRIIKNQKEVRVTNGFSFRLQ